MSGRPAPKRTSPVPSHPDPYLRDVFDYIRSYGSETHLRATKIASIELFTVQIELEKLRMSHYSCEDEWYSCPKSEDGCMNPADGDDCNCGADSHNEILDNVIKYLKKATEL